MSGTARRDAPLLLPNCGLKGGLLSGRFQRRLSASVGRDPQREIERLYAEPVRLKADALQSNGDRPIRLSPDQQRRLQVLRRKIDPEVLRKFDLLTDAE
jgi:hypothetical protein